MSKFWSSEKIEDFLQTDEEELILPKCNAFLRKLIYNTAEERLVGRASLGTRTLENKDRIMYVTKPKTTQEKLEEDQKKIAEELEELETAIGFSKVIRHLMDSVRLFSDFLD